MAGEVKGRHYRTEQGRYLRVLDQRGATPKKCPTVVQLRDDETSRVQAACEIAQHLPYSGEGRGCFMKTENSRVASNLARLVGLLARRKSFSQQLRGGSSQLDVLSVSPARSDEQGRRSSLLSELYRRHAVEVAGENGEMVYRDTLPPDAWVNSQLARRGEDWRVHNVDGFRCEIYEI